MQRAAVVENRSIAPQSESCFKGPNPRRKGVREEFAPSWRYEYAREVIYSVGAPSLNCRRAVNRK
jgi:hypothetical protein